MGNIFVGFVLVLIYALGNNLAAPFSAAGGPFFHAIFGTAIVFMMIVAFVIAYYILLSPIFRVNISTVYYATRLLGGR